MYCITNRLPSHYAETVAVLSPVIANMERVHELQALKHVTSCASSVVPASIEYELNPRAGTGHQPAGRGVKESPIAL